MTTPSDTSVPPPLKITCTSSDCDADLHCFKSTQKLVEVNKVGACRSCGIELIDWTRVHRRDVRDVDFVFSELRHEMVRHYFWHLDFDQRALDHAARKGRVALNQAARRRIEVSVAREGNPREGRQTPREGNTIYYAQHATACCCRRCIEYWHDIPHDRDLTLEEVDYLTALATRYLEERLPNLAQHPIRVPRRMVPKESDAD